MSVKHHLIKIFVLLLCSSCGYAQSILNKLDPKVDTTYINLRYDNWSLRTVGTFKYQNLTIRDEKGNSVRYIPSDRTAVGLGFAYKFLVVDIGIRLLLARDFTSRFDLQGELALQKHLIDVFVQRYKGFEASTEMTDSFRDDIRSWVIGINYLYNFNSERLSIRSVLTGNRIQKKSAGSFVAGGFISVQDLKADTSVVAGNNGFNEAAQINDSRLVMGGLQGGAAYILKMTSHWYLFGGIMPGIGIMEGNAEGQTSYDIKLKPFFKLNTRAAVGYMGRKVYGGLLYSADHFFLDIDNQNKMDYNIGKIKLVFGYKFNSGIKLIDRVVD
ncbi:MAG: DUF4421 family protein [Fulvivirga sp.]|nr:DUF4421 family protein [Fulvivirga sp.]